MAAQVGDKKVCVTGGSGFVAATLIKLLLEKGYFVNTTVRDPEGCEFVFHVATPINFASEDPENDLIKPAIQGVVNVLKASARVKSVKRVVLTSSAAALAINTLEGTGLVMTEDNWTDVEFLSNAKPPTWGYSLSKTLAEKKAWEFAEEHNIDLITVIPSLITGTSITSDVPSSIDLATCLLSG